MSPIVIENSQANIFGRTEDCQTGDLSVDVAKFILSLDLATADELRMDELAEHAR